MLKCHCCDNMVVVGMIKYHTADNTKIFCGAECSLKYYTHLREEENEKEN
jgi:hypothetical protein